MYEVLDISTYIIHKYWCNGSTITNLKLQKILYYIQGYALRQNNDCAFPESIYKWPFGPVVPEAYFAYNKYRAQNLPEPSLTQLSPILKKFKFDKSLTQIIDSVIKKSFPYSAAKMVDMTHQEDPWKNATDSEIISSNAILAYFTLSDPLKLEED